VISPLVFSPLHRPGFRGGQVSGTRPDRVSGLRLPHPLSPSPRAERENTRLNWKTLPGRLALPVHPRNSPARLTGSICFQPRPHRSQLRGPVLRQREYAVRNPTRGPGPVVWST